ncbi:MAG: MFS transporter [Anaerolineae bacterium]|nr:MFS transporter [Anaerolineae bacterium]
MPRITRRQMVITFGLMMGLFLAALEGTVVSTAMPTIVAQLGGLEVYSWVFSIYMLASTTTIPIFGRLSDLYGRKPIYYLGVTLFLAGSVLSGQAQNMTQLILFRALQGTGAGALMPVTFTIIGDIFSLEQRARMQGFFSSVWGISSVIGPLVGGFLVDNVSWRWVFYLNLPFGLLAVGLLALVLHEPLKHREPGTVDYRGAALLVAAVLSLLYALLQGGQAYAWTDPRTLGLLGFAAAALAAFVWIERRAAHPLIPLDMFGDRLFAIAMGHEFLAGFAVFGVIAYIPLFVQGALGTSATRAGATLTPMSVVWGLGSVLAGALLLRHGPARLVIAGTLSLLGGASLLALLDERSSQLVAAGAMALMGFGMGLVLTSFLVSVQNRVPSRRMGVATGSLQFISQIGGTVGVSVLGAVMSARLSRGLASLPGGAGVDPVMLLDRSSTVELPAAVDAAFQSLLAEALHPAFLLTLGVAALALGVALLTPRGTLAQLEQSELARLGARETMPHAAVAAPAKVKRSRR